MLLIFKLLNLPTNNAVKDYTIRYLRNYADNNEVLNQVQILIALSKLDMVSEFEIFLSENEESKKIIPNYMIRSVLRRFLVSKKLSNEKVQKLISLYFSFRRSNNI